MISLKTEGVMKGDVLHHTGLKDLEIDAIGRN
jgi:hypothetical protein